METGTKISFGLHGVILGLAAFGGPLFDSDDSQAIQISEVSLISSAEFDSMMSSAPVPDVVEPEQSLPSAETETAEVPVIEQPVVEQPAPEVQEPTPIEESPDLAVVIEPALPDVPVEAPEIAEQPQEATGSAIVVPDAVVAEEDSSGEVAPDQLALLRPKPRPAPRVDNKVAPKPPTDAETSTEAAESSKPEDSAEATAEPVEEAAPKESTTEIVTEADEPDPDSAAPVKSARPKGRPADIVAKAKAAKEQAAKAAADKVAADEAAKAKAAKEAEAKAIEAALKAATSEASKPSGPPMTGREKGALVLAVQQCWTPPTGVQNAGDLKVTLKVELSPDGKVIGAPRLIEPAGAPTALEKVAFDAGRRALLRCQPYALPREKYEQWRHLEVVFNPQKMVVR